MTGKRSKDHYVAKGKVECMACGKVILSENKSQHIKLSHNNQNVEFKFYNDSKQMKLMFTVQDVNSNNSSCAATMLSEPCDNKTDGIQTKVCDSNETGANSDNKNEPQNKVSRDMPLINVDGDRDNKSHANNLEQEEQISDIGNSTSSDNITGIELVVTNVINNNDEVTATVQEEEESNSDQNVPMQPILEKYNPKKYDHIRDFQSSWYIKHPWINYDVSTHSVSCFPCQKFLKDSEFSFDNWKKTGKLTKHSNSEPHLRAMIMWGEYNSAQKNKVNVISQISSEHAKQVAENREYLRLVIETVAFLAKQNISFRAHKECRQNLTKESESNRGNFLELLSLRAKDSTLLRERLNSDKVQWTTWQIQNEIISLLAKFTESKIMQQVKNDTFDQNYIGIICDETSDISRHEQISLVISYIDSDGIKKETFLGFIETATTDGETLFNLIKDKLCELDINLETIVGLGFDGAANMSGGNKGVAKRFKEVSPMSTYVHCYGHILNLCVKDTLSESQTLRHTLGIIQSVYNFIEVRVLDLIFWSILELCF